MFVTIHKLSSHKKVCKTCKQDHNVQFNEQEAQQVIIQYINNSQPDNRTHIVRKIVEPIEDIFLKYTSEWSDFYLYLLDVLLLTHMTSDERSGTAIKYKRSNPPLEVVYNGRKYTRINSLYYIFKNDKNQIQSIRSILLEYMLMKATEKTQSEQEFIDKIDAQLKTCIKLRTKVDVDTNYDPFQND